MKHNNKTDPEGPVSGRVDSISCFPRRGSDKGKKLSDDLGNDAGADGTAAFADRETQAFFHRDRVDQLDGDRHVIAWHDHFFVRWQLDRTGHVRGTEVELWTIVV